MLFPKVLVAEGLTLDTVFSSIKTYHPSVLRELEKLGAKEADLLSARGSFDTRLEADARSYADGFYTGSNASSRLLQPLEIGGADVFTEYRVGNGSFPVYEDELVTLDGGELSLGFEFSLLRDRAVDSRRNKLRLSEMGVDAQRFQIEEKKLELFRQASELYWAWRYQNQVLGVFRKLLEVAEKRQTQLEKRAEAGDLAPFDVKDNQRIILKRREQILKEEMKLEEIQAKLSIYLREEGGDPLDFSSTKPPSRMLSRPNPVPQLVSLLSNARSMRPEFQILDFRQKMIFQEQGFAESNVLPRLDLRSTLSRDLGNGSVSRQDEEWKVGLQFELPLQRREAKGDLMRLESELRQVRYERQLLEEQVNARLKVLLRLWKKSKQRLDTLEHEVKATAELEEGERLRFGNGDSNLIFVALREVASGEVLQRKLATFANLNAITTEIYLESGDIDGLSSKFR
jgi:outer membrane protein TolC